MIVTIVYAEDWAGLYLDGLLVEDASCIDMQTALDAVCLSGKAISEVRTMQCDQSWVEDNGMPSNLCDVVTAK